MKRYFWQTYVGLAIYGLGSAILFGFLLPTDLSTSASLVIVAVGCLATSFFITTRMTKPFSQLETRLRRMAASDSIPIGDPKKFEIVNLARSLDSIGKQLRSRIETTTNQTNQQAAVFSSMSEGVIALDGSKRILELNKAAANILKLDRKTARGHNIVELVRIPEILDLIEDTLAFKMGGERDVEISEGDARFLQVRARPLLETNNTPKGIVLVLSDVTRLNELEGMRKNFVANVSHELRTPLTSIQGFAETLLNPAVKDVDEMRKFVAIIQKHATRLGQIIEDLLTLSRLDRDEEVQSIDKKVVDLQTRLTDAAEMCEVKAEARGVVIKVECPSELKVPMDPNLIEQAIVNLIDNAIRYSASGKMVTVKGMMKGDDCVVQVVDHGPGIPDKHLTRLFERFYRVDKARSRELGGTGLGLSIVKHIVLAHKGRVEVQSKVGEGSTFSLIWPVKKSQT